MTDNIVTLAPKGDPSQPNELAIERAEQLLADAKSGVLQGFIVTGETAAGELYEGGASIFDLPMVLLGLKMAERRLLEFAEGAAADAP